MCKMAWWLAPATVWIGLAGLADRAVAQNGDAEAQSSTVIITLGTRGGPLPTKDRAQSSNLLVVNGTLYLIDAGDGVTRRIVQAGFDFLKVGKVFITHPHSDHTNGLATLLASEWEYQRREPIDVYGGGVQPLVKGVIDYLTPNAEIRWAEGKKTPMADIFHGHDVVPGLLYQDANVMVTAVENTHFHFPQGSPPYGKYRSYSYRFETPSRVVVFTGDTGGDRAGERRRRAGHRSWIARRCDRTLQAQWHLAVENPVGAGGLRPSHGGGARHAGGGWQDRGEGRCQDDRTDALGADR